MICARSMNIPSFSSSSSCFNLSLGIQYSIFKTCYVSAYKNIIVNFPPIFLFLGRCIYCISGLGRCVLRSSHCLGSPSGRGISSRSCGYGCRSRGLWLQAFVVEVVGLVAVGSYDCGSTCPTCMSRGGSCRWS